jgi:hypothetical protein
MASLRKQLLEKIILCTPEQQMVFRRMYCHENLSLDIQLVVNLIPAKKVSWALQQVLTTLERTAPAAPLPSTDFL